MFSSDQLPILIKAKFLIKAKSLFGYNSNYLEFNFKSMIA